MIRCEECGYDLRGCKRIGRCPECGVEFDQETLRADQERSYDRITLALRVIAVAVSVYVVNALLWVVWEDLLRVQNTTLELVTVRIGIPGGALLLLALGLVLLQLQRRNRLHRPCTDVRQARLIPIQTRFWIAFDLCGLLFGMTICWGNPLWHWVWRCFR